MNRFLECRGKSKTTLVKRAVEKGGRENIYNCQIKRCWTEANVIKAETAAMKLGRVTRVAMQCRLLCNL